MKKNILFVCRYNRFRSRIAESYFKKINKNKKIKIKSAGLIKGEPLNKSTINLAKKFGLNIKGKIQGLSHPVMIWQNISVIVADDVPLSVFAKNKKQGKKVIVWKIRDVDERKGRTADKIIKEIIKKVDDLNEQLGKK